MTYGVIEQGTEFGVDMIHSPLEFLAKVTDFWGLRLGFEARGLFSVRDCDYVFEIGAGTF